jgi:hypothetical protein
MSPMEQLKKIYDFLNNFIHPSKEGKIDFGVCYSEILSLFDSSIQIGDFEDLEMLLLIFQC